MTNGPKRRAPALSLAPTANSEETPFQIRLKTVTARKKNQENHNAILSMVNKTIAILKHVHQKNKLLLL